jgi:hypothetical protein
VFRRATVDWEHAMNAAVRVGRALLLVLEAASYAIAALALAVLLRQILFVFLLVTLGTPGMQLGMALQILDDGLPPLEEIYYFVVFLVPGASLLCTRLARRHGVWLALRVAQVLLAIVAIAVSYRMPALVILVVMSVLLTRKPLDRRPRRTEFIPIVLLLIFSALPVDVSLQVRPGRPGFAQAVAGLITGSGPKETEEDHYVFVGGCVAPYKEPRWVWVW